MHSYMQIIEQEQTWKRWLEECRARRCSCAYRRGARETFHWIVRRSRTPPQPPSAECSRRSRRAGAASREAARRQSRRGPDRSARGAAAFRGSGSRSASSYRLSLEGRASDSWATRAWKYSSQRANLSQGTTGRTWCIEGISPSFDSPVIPSCSLLNKQHCQRIYTNLNTW